MQWSEYVRTRSEGRLQSDIALLVGVDQSTISRWKRGKGGQPSPDNAMALARAVGESPIVALLAAGYLDEDEVEGVVRVAEGLSTATTDALLAELGRRLGLHVDVRREATG